MIKAEIAAIGCAAALALAACGNTDAGGPATNDPSASADESPKAGGSTVSAKELCDYLESELPNLKAIGSQVGAMARLTVNLYNWYDKRGVTPNGAEMDQKTSKECPEIKAEVNKVAGIQSFATL